VVATTALRWTTVAWSSGLVNILQASRLPTDDGKAWADQPGMAVTTRHRVVNV
jgi:hypothetical protein